MTILIAAPKSQSANQLKTHDWPSAASVTSRCGQEATPAFPPYARKIVASRKSCLVCSSRKPSMVIHSRALAHSSVWPTTPSEFMAWRCVSKDDDGLELEVADVAQIKNCAPKSLEKSEPSHFEWIVRQIASPTSPSSTDVFSCGRSPLFHSAAVCNTRYLMGPPSGLSLREMGRGMQTNSVRISATDNCTFA